MQRCRSACRRSSPPPASSSRRAAETLIARRPRHGERQTVTELGSKADPDADDIRVDGRRVKAPRRRRYILMYKPRGYITSRSDPEQRPTVIDLLRKGGVREYIYPVGRLDYDSEGLLLLTSDGDLAEQLMHPSHGVAREYHARVRGVPDEQTLDRLVARRSCSTAARPRRRSSTSSRCSNRIGGGDAILSLRDPRRAQPPGAQDVRSGRAPGGPAEARAHRSDHRRPAQARANSAT